MSTSVKHIHSGMRGAPTINGTAGTLIAALDAFFTTGWGVTTALSVNVASGVATATLTPGETFDRDAVVLVGGATPGDLNGEARVLSSSNTSITWATVAADGAATGTITIRYAPQTAWEKVYAGTNKAAYRSTDVQAHGHYLRVDDTGTTTARARGYETMTDVDTGSGLFPLDAQMSGGGHWWKSGLASATATRWFMFSDERMLLVAISPGSANSAANLSCPLRGFGDPIVLSPSGDAWGTFLSASWTTPSTANGGALESSVDSNLTQGISVFPRSISGLGSAVLASPRLFSGSPASLSGLDAFFGDLPSSVDGQVKTSRVYLREPGGGSPPRVVVPGVFYIPQGNANAFLNHEDKLEGAGELVGRRLVVLSTSANFNAAAPGRYLVDITGPWR